MQKRRSETEEIKQGQRQSLIRGLNTTNLIKTQAAHPMTIRNLKFPSRMPTNGFNLLRRFRSLLTLRDVHERCHLRDISQGP